MQVWLNDSLTPVFVETVNGISIWKCGKIHMATLNNIGSITVTSGIWTTIATVTNLPKFQVSSPLEWTSGGSIPTTAIIRIDTDGKISIYSNTNTLVYVNGFLTYMV